MEPLQGIKVLDFGSFITAPYAAMLLAEYGADVVKIEKPSTGDPFRAFGSGLYSPQYQAHNKHKRSMAFDFAQAAGADVLKALIEAADVVIVNARPGVTARQGIDYASVRKMNPRVVYGSITGFGDTGPYAMRPAFDNVGQALSGWTSRFRTGDDPRVVGPAISDAATGMNMALGIMAALVRRAATGEGAKVDVNMVESTIALGIEPMTQYLNAGEAVPVFQRAAASQAYNLNCADGRRIGLHLSSPDKFWQSLCQAIERPDLAAAYPARADRVRGYEALAVALNDVFQSRPRSQWERLLAAHDVPFAPELALEEVQHDPQVQHLQVFHDLSHPRQGVRRATHRPVRVDGRREESLRAPPELGEHTREMLRELGFSDARVAELARAGIVGIEPAE